MVEQKKASVGGSLLGSQHKYVLPGTGGASRIDVALDPAELETLDEDALRRKYEEQVRLQAAGQGDAQTTSLLAEVLEERRRKRSRAGGSGAGAQGGDTQPTKRARDFKF